MKKFYNPLPNGDDQRNGDQFDDDQFNNDGHFETEKTAFWRPNGTGVSLVNTISLKAWAKIQTLKSLQKTQITTPTQHYMKDHLRSRDDCIE